MTATRGLTVRTWARVDVPDALCGNCRRGLALGDPVQKIQIDGVAKPKLRCQNCADSDAPADLPALVERPAIILAQVPKHQGADALPFDYRLDAGDRQLPPGDRS